MAYDETSIKWCPKCKRVLSIFCFSGDKRRQDGLSFYCRECRKAVRKVYSDAHREEIQTRDRERSRLRPKEVTRAASRKWREANPKLAQERAAASRAKKPEHYSAKRVAWKTANAELLKAQDIAWRKANPGKVRLTAKRYRLAHPEKYRLTKARHRLANLEKIRRARAARRTANLEQFRQVARAWRQANRERVLAFKALRRARIKQAPGGGWTEADVVEIHELQRGRCALCRIKIPTGFHRDHITSLAKGGRHERRNLQLLCQPCNQRKSDRDPIDHARSLGLLI